MTTESSATDQPLEPAPHDAADTGPTPLDDQSDPEEESDSDKDAMGIDDDDPLDAALVGKPVKDTETPRDTSSNSDEPEE